MPIAWHNRGMGVHRQTAHREQVDHEGFSVIHYKHKPNPIQPVKVDAMKAEPPKSTAPIYHPDFAESRSPSDVLFQTGDGVLFWFSLSLLSYHSPRFALLDPETLWLRSKPVESTSVLNILAIDSSTFALIAHTLLFDYALRQKALYFEDIIVDNLSHSIFDGEVVQTLRKALSFAKAVGIASFDNMVTPLMAEFAERLIDLQTYADYETGSQNKQLLGM